MLEKPKEYKEVKSRQNDDTIYAEDINQIISNIELIKGGSSDESPAGNIKDIYERLKGGGVSSPSSANLISFDNSKTDLDFSTKEINIQNAIEILDKKVNELINNLGLGDNYDIYNFEKSSILMGENTLQDNVTKDCANLTLVKNDDGSYSLKGNIELIENYSENSAVLIKTTNRVRKKLTRNIIPIIIDQDNGIQLMPLYDENYLYLCIFLNDTISSLNLDGIKIIDNKIVLFNNSMVNVTALAELSEDFGIYYDNGKYKLKGKITLLNQSITTTVNIGMSDFFENGETYTISTEKGNLYIVAIFTNMYNGMLTISGVASQTYNLDWELPKQPK